MLKQFLKTLFIGVLSSTLTINPVVAQYAAPDSKPVVTTDADGTKSAKVSYKFQGVKDGDMIASIVMLATGVIASRLLIKYKPVSTDMMIAAAGGVAFIAGEVMSNMKFKGTIEEKTAEIVLKKGSTPNQEQIESLQKLKESYEEAKKATKTKKMLQMAAAAAFAGAAAMAGYMAYTEYSTMMACQTSMKAALPALKSCIAAAAVPDPSAQAQREAAACKACLAPLTSVEGSLVKIEAERISPNPSGQDFAKVGAMQTAAKTTLGGATATCSAGIASKAAGTPAITSCTAAMNLESLNQIFAYDPTKLTNNQILNKILYPHDAPVFSYEQMQSKEFNPNFLQKGLEFIFPTAQASWLPMLGLAGGAALGYFGASYTGLAIQTDMFMFVPFNRIIAWGTLGALTLLAVKSSDNTLKKLDENIAKIDQILNELNNLQKAIATQNVKGMGIQVQTVDPISQTLPSYSIDNKTKSQCMTSNSTSNCSSLEEQITNVPGYSQLPPAFQTIATQSTKMADGLSGSTGMSGAAMNAANSLAGKQNAINGLLKKTQNSLNALLKKNKKSPIDFDKEQEKFYKGMAASVRKSLQQKGTTAAGFMASYGGAPLDSSAIGKPINLGQDDKSNVPVMTGIGGAPAPEEDKTEDFKFEDAPLIAENVAASGAADNAHYDVRTDEIHKDNGPSLFELISNRYFQSGYPKLLEEEPTKK